MSVKRQQKEEGVVVGMVSLASFSEGSYVQDCDSVQAVHEHTHMHNKI